MDELNSLLLRTASYLWVYHFVIENCIARSRQPWVEVANSTPVVWKWTVPFSEDSHRKKWLLVRDWRKLLLAQNNWGVCVCVCRGGWEIGQGKFCESAVVHCTTPHTLEPPPVQPKMAVSHCHSGSNAWDQIWGWGVARPDKNHCAEMHTAALLLSLLLWQQRPWWIQAGSYILLFSLFFAFLLFFFWFPLLEIWVIWGWIG